MNDTLRTVQIGKAAGQRYEENSNRLRSLSVTIAQNGYVIYPEYTNYPLMDGPFIATTPTEVASRIEELLSNAQNQDQKS